MLVLVWGLALGGALWASGIDVALQGWLWAHYDQAFNTAMRVLGEIGKGSFEAAMCVIAGGFLWFYGWRQGRVSAKTAGWTIMAAVPVFALAGAVNWLLKWGIGRGRPKVWLMGHHNAWEVHHFSMKSEWWSFPSGHSCSTFAVAVWLALAFPRWRVPFLAVAAVLALSRALAVTPHYLGDVAAGAGVGAAIAGWAWVASGRWRHA